MWICEVEQKDGKTEEKKKIRRSMEENNRQMLESLENKKKNREEEKKWRNRRIPQKTCISRFKKFIESLAQW